MIFRDRRHAGRQLARRLERCRNLPDTVVLALPRGGVPVAYEVARALHAPLDLFLVRKIGLPGHEEFAVGALADGGIRVLDLETLRRFRLTPEDLAEIEAKERAELARQSRAFRGDRPPPDVERRNVILVDDGVATGASMGAAIEALRRRRPKRILVAVPVAPPETCRALRSVADEVICDATPEPFLAVGRWYDQFPQVDDAEVRRLLAAADTLRRDRLPEHEIPETYPSTL